MSDKPVFLMASANPSQDQVDLRNDLEAELSGIQDILFGAFSAELEIMYRPRLTTDQFLAIADNDISQRIIGFHYAGHGEEEGLLFQTEAGWEEKAFAYELKRTFQAWPLLRFAFLNCCLSADLAEGIATEKRLVLASPYLLQSGAAKEMALGFYRSFVQRDRSIARAFDGGVRQIGMKVGPPSTEGATRGLVRKKKTELPGQLAWEKVWQKYPRNSEMLEDSFEYQLTMARYDLRRPTRRNQPERKLMATGLSVDFASQKKPCSKPSKKTCPKRRAVI